MQGGKKRILFFGELPPATLHGASISNKINVDILKSKYLVTIVEEYSDLKYHGSISSSKALAFFKSFWIYFKKLIALNHSFYYSVVYLSSAGICKNILLVLLFKIRNPRSSVILHFHRSDINSFLQRRLNFFLFYLLNIFVTRYIALARKQQEELRILGVKKVAVLYNTIETEFLPGQLETIYGSPNEIKMVYIGNYIREKGIFDMLQAVEKYNNFFTEKITLNCYGSFSSAVVRDKLVSLAKESPYITINQQVSGKEKYQIIYSSDVTILPSYNEGLPISLLESMSLGKPMIITNVGYISEALGEDYKYYCLPGNINSIVDAIRLFHARKGYPDSDEMRSKYKKFSFENHTNGLLKIFRV